MGISSFVFILCTYLATGRRASVSLEYSDPLRVYAGLAKANATNASGPVLPKTASQRLGKKQTDDLEAVLEPLQPSTAGKEIKNIEQLPEHTESFGEISANLSTGDEVLADEAADDATNMNLSVWTQVGWHGTSWAAGQNLLALCARRDHPHIYDPGYHWGPGQLGPGFYVADKMVAQTYATREGMLLKVFVRDFHNMKGIYVQTTNHGRPSRVPRQYQNEVKIQCNYGQVPPKAEQMYDYFYATIQQSIAPWWGVEESKGGPPSAFRITSGGWFPQPLTNFPEETMQRKFTYRALRYIAVQEDTAYSNAMAKYRR